MELEKILTDIRTNRFSPVYILMGEETYFIDQIADTLEKHAISEADRDLNLTLLYGRDTDINQVVSEAKSFPMFGERKLVMVREAQNLKGLTEKEETEELDSLPKKKETHPLLSYAENPQPSSILCICVKYKNLDKRKSYFKALEKNKNVIIFQSDKIRENKIDPFIYQYAKSVNLKISDKAVSFIKEFLGTDLQKISNELDKIALSLPHGKEVEPSDVMTYVGINKDFNSFELTKSLALLNFTRCIKIAEYFGNDKNHPMPLTISSLYSFFIKVLAFQNLKIKSNLSEEDAARELGLNYYSKEDVVKASANYKPLKVKKIIHLIHEYDLKFKGVGSNQIPEDELLKELILKILL
jgi:DNA polymerase-3 subunit delta